VETGSGVSGGGDFVGQGRPNLAAGVRSEKSGIVMRAASLPEPATCGDLGFAPVGQQMLPLNQAVMGWRLTFRDRFAAEQMMAAVVSAASASVLQGSDAFNRKGISAARGGAMGRTR